MVICTDYTDFTDYTDYTDFTDFTDFMCTNTRSEPRNTNLQRVAIQMVGIGADSRLRRALADMTDFINNLKGADSPCVLEDTRCGSVSNIPAAACSRSKTNLFNNDITPYEQERLNNIEQNKRKMQEIFGDEIEGLIKKHKMTVLCNAKLNNGQACKRPKMSGKDGCHWHCAKPKTTTIEEQNATETASKAVLEPNPTDAELKESIAEISVGEIDFELEKEIESVLEELTGDL